MCWAVAVLASGVLAALLPAVPALAAMFSAALFFLMAMIVLTDLRCFTVPDVLSLPAIPLGLLANALLAPDGIGTEAVVDGLSGAVIGASVLFLLRAAYFRLRGIEGLGLGDVKLAGVAGAWLGPAALAPVCLLAALAAFICLGIMAAFRSKDGIHARLPVPFGGFIAPSIFVIWMGDLLGILPIR